MVKSVGIAALLVVLAAVSPVAAASITTDAFVAVAAPTLDALAAADALAVEAGNRPSIRAFAHHAQHDGAAAHRELATWRQAEANARARDAAGVTLDGFGPVAGLLSLPYDTVARVSNTIGPPATILPSDEVTRHHDRQALAQLQMAQGAAFDADYIAFETDALARLEAIYKSFILNGDDPILRRLAVHHLPAVESLLARVRRLRA